MTPAEELRDLANMLRILAGRVKGYEVGLARAAALLDPDPPASLFPELAPVNTKAKAAAPAEDPFAGFDEFWGIYPRKCAKGDARVAWFQTQGKRPPLPELLGKVKSVAAGWLAGGRQKSKMPYPATFLRVLGWEDEVQEPDAPRAGTPLQQRRAQGSNPNLPAPGSDAVAIKNEYRKRP